MATTDDLHDAILENAQGPARATVDGQTVEQHPLKDQLDALDRLKGSTAARKPHRGLRFTKLISPGPTG